MRGSGSALGRNDKSSARSPAGSGKKSIIARVMNHVSKRLQAHSTSESRPQRFDLLDRFDKGKSQSDDSLLRKHSTTTCCHTHVKEEYSLGIVNSRVYVVELQGETEAVEKMTRLGCVNASCRRLGDSSHDEASSQTRELVLCGHASSQVANGFEPDEGIKEPTTEVSGIQLSDGTNIVVQAASLPEDLCIDAESMACGDLKSSSTRSGDSKGSGCSSESDIIVVESDPSIHRFLNTTSDTSLADLMTRTDFADEEDELDVARCWMAEELPALPKGKPGTRGSSLKDPHIRLIRLESSDLTIPSSLLEDNDDYSTMCFDGDETIEDSFACRQEQGTGHGLDNGVACIGILKDVTCCVPDLD